MGRARRLALIFVLTIAGTACGTRVAGTANEAFSGETRLASGAPAATSPSLAQPASPTVSVAPGQAPSGPARPLSRSQPPAHGSAASNAITTPGPPTGDTVVGIGRRGSTPTGPAPQQSSPGPALSSPAPSGGSREPVVIGSLGTYSGPVGAVAEPILSGVQLWVKNANANGGLDGRPVTLRVYDDGGDPARYRALAQQAIETDHVIAFVGNVQPFTGAASKDYFESKRVPLIGLSGAEDYAYTSPMIFPQTTVARPMLWATLAAGAQQLVPIGKVKIGSLSCTEAELCRTGAQLVHESAQALGFELVYEGKMSLAQPDFTAECLAARNAGAAAMILLFESNSIRRFANSCLRQGYEPVLMLSASLIIDSMAKEPGFEGAIGQSTTFPYFQTGTPATDEYARARATFGPNLTNGVALTTGWTAAKLFEAAAAHTTGQLTRESVLRGLWSLKGDDLGGLTQPLTFAEGQLPGASACWFRLQVKNHQWVSPDGFKRYCHAWGDPQGYGYRP